MAEYIANVGVNASHRARSPLYADGRFLLLPIPEREAWRPPMLRLADRPRLASAAPAAWGDLPVHLDPDLEGDPPTYGDNCRTAGRAFSLRSAQPGDRIRFLARLHPVGGEPAIFALVGQLVIAAVLADVVADPGPGWWDANAHVRRARAHGRWDSFWVFRGGPGSGLYPVAQLFARAEAETLFGGGWLWRRNRTELQTIGSYTRAVRRLA